MPSRPATQVTVLVNGAPDPTLRALSVHRGTGGALKDQAVIEVDLSEKGTGGQWIQNVTLNAMVGAQIQVVAYPNGAPTLLHSGTAVVPSLAIGDSERLTFTSRVEPWHFGAVMDGVLCFNPLTGLTQVWPEECVFNAEIDGVALPNQSQLFRQLGQAPVFLDPESVRTPSAVAVQGDTPVFWTLQTAVAYLCWALNPAQVYIANPTGFGLLPAWPLQNFQLPRGKFLCDYLDELLPRFGLTWGLDLSSGVPTIAFVVRGQGAANAVTLAPPGSVYSLATGTNAADTKLDYDVGNTRNQAVVYGDWHFFESTFVLSRGWAVGLDGLTESNLSRDSSNYNNDLSVVRDVWRKWVLNEAGDYVGLRPEILKPFDLGPLVGHPVIPRRRQFLPTVTLDDDLAPRGETHGVSVEYSTDLGATWKNVRSLEDRTIVILERECGIRFDGLFPPAELVRAGASAMVRVTATIRDDVRLGTIYGPDGGSPLAQPAPFLIDESEKFHWRDVLPTSKYSAEVAAGTLPSAQADDLVALTEYAVWLQQVWDIADAGGQITLEGLDVGVYQLGDLIATINGRSINLNAQGAAGGGQRYPQVVGLNYDLQAQRRTLTVETYRDPGQRHGTDVGGRRPDKNGVRKRSEVGDCGEKPVRRYRLTAALAAGGSASAKFRKWDPVASAYADAGQTFTLYSYHGVTGQSGDEGDCVYFADRQQWEAVEAPGSTGAVRVVTFLLPQALDGTLVSFSAPVLTDWYGNAGGANVTVINELGWVSDAGSKGYAIYRPADGLWPIIVVPCASETS